MYLTRLPGAPQTGACRRALWLRARRGHFSATPGHAAGTALEALTGFRPTLDLAPRFIAKPEPGESQSFPRPNESGNGCHTEPPPPPPILGRRRRSSLTLSQPPWAWPAGSPCRSPGHLSRHGGRSPSAIPAREGEEAEKKKTSKKTDITSGDWERKQCI